MPHEDDLQRIWQSQHVAPVPTFALLDDQTVPVRFPYARTTRWTTAASRLVIGFNFALQWRHAQTTLEHWGIVVGTAGGVACAIFTLLQSDRSPGLEPEVSLQEYRNRSAREYDRQAAVERREVMLLGITFLIACALLGVARREFWLPIFGGLLIIFAERWRRKQVDKARRRL